MQEYFTQIDKILKVDCIKLPKQKEKKNAFSFKFKEGKNEKGKDKHCLKIYERPKKDKLKYLSYFSTPHSKNPSTQASTSYHSTWVNKNNESKKNKNSEKKERSKSIRKPKFIKGIKKIKSQNPEHNETSMHEYLVKDLRLRIREERTGQEWKQFLQEFKNVNPKQQKQINIILREFQKLSELRLKQEEQKYKLMSNFEYY